MDQVAQLTYFGGPADDGLINAYDFSRATQGFSRVLNIVGHYYLTGKIIRQAPASHFEVMIAPPEAGSVKQTFYATVAGGVIVLSLDKLIDYALDQWIPSATTAEQILDQEIEQTRLLEELNQKFETAKRPKLSAEDRRAIERIQPELGVIQSMVSGSLRETFRPVEQCPKMNAQIYTGPREIPSKPVSAEIASVLESDVRDGKIRTITMRVTGFSRGSKTGTAYSQQLNRGFRFEYRGQEGKLPERDIFSRSQFYQEDIIAEGEFISHFNGDIKKMLIYYAGPAKGS